jgi:hypothetical protein
MGIEFLIFQVFFLNYFFKCSKVQVVIIRDCTIMFFEWYLSGHFDYFWYKNVDISNNLSGELYLQNESELFINNGLKECIYVYYAGSFKLINKYLLVEIRCSLLNPYHYCRRVYLTGRENIIRPFVQNYHYLLQLTATGYLHRRDHLNEVE